MILKSIILLILIFIIIKKLYIIPIKKLSKFYITQPRFKSIGNKKYANFNILIKRRHIFLVDFPVIFKFYSNSIFKAKIKIVYTTLGNDCIEEILNKEIISSDKVLKQEHIYHITDIILGKIEIEIELDCNYGQPIISFEILKNPLIKLLKSHRIEINFPKII